MKPARTRMAPSPTGRFHLGSARTALFDYLLARKTGGQFILRLEDTDRKRFVPGSEEEILRSLDWLGITPDESPVHGGKSGPYRQTERKELYQHYANKLIHNGNAYPCFCSPERLEESRKQQQAQKVDRVKYDGLCRSLSPEEGDKRVRSGENHIIRFKMPQDGSTTAHDHLRGDIVTENKHLDDYVLMKSDGLPTYHLAAMVDDYEMGITHVLRSSEWLPTFPLHVNIVRAFGWDEPVWIHLSVFLKPSGKGKMSKRDAVEALKDGKSIFVDDLKGLGYIPEGVLNWVALMGWGVAENDIMSLNEMVERFSIDSLTASPAGINFQKLDHFNGAQIRLLSTDDLAARIKPFFINAGFDVNENTLLELTPLIRERLVTLDDCVEFAGFFFKDKIDLNTDVLLAKGLNTKESGLIAKKILEIFSGQNDNTIPVVEKMLRDYVDSGPYNAGQVFGILRAAATGQKVSPPLFESIEIIGRDKVIDRLKLAVSILDQ